MSAVVATVVSTTIPHQELNPTHFVEWSCNSGVSEELTRLSVTSLDDQKDIARLLGWKGYSGTPGWSVRGIDLETGQYSNFGQFKPNSPILFPDSGKPQKYLSFPKGSESEAILLVIDLLTWVKVSEKTGVKFSGEDIDSDRKDLGFWRWVQNHPEIPVLITEGAKKAGCLLTQGYAAICLTGVWNGQVDKKKLIPSLAPFATTGRPIYLVFDGDIIEKDSVSKALENLGCLLQKNKTLVKVVTWDLKLGKGCDDLILAHSSEEFQSAMSNATAYEKWFKGLENQFSESGNNPRCRKQFIDIVAAEIAEDYRDKLKFNNESCTWMRYETDYPGVWSAETKEFIEKIVGDALEAKNINYSNFSFVEGVVKALRIKLITRKWIEPNPQEFLQFKNKVLEISTGKVLEHCPSYGFTWTLPREYNPLATDWSLIDNWFNEVTSNDESLKNILLCYLNAVLKGRSDLERFLYLTGEGGTGKSTYMRLVASLIGERNVHSSSLKEWESSRFETSSAYLKRLLLFPDEAKQPGSIENLKKATGRDLLRAEEKGKKSFNYVYDGMVIIASNYPIFIGEKSSALQRKMLPVPFKNVISAFLRRDISKEFEPYLSALINYVLAIPDEIVTKTLLQIDNISSASVQQYWEDRLTTDNLASWVNDHLIPDPLSRERTGNDKDNEETLFGNYYQYCRRSGGEAKSCKSFVTDLKNFLKHTLKWENIESVHNGLFRGLSGVRFRNDRIDENTPCPIDQLCYQQQVKIIQSTSSISSLTDGDVSVDRLANGLEPLPDKASYASDGLNPTSETNKNQQLDILKLSSKSNCRQKIPPNPSDMSKPIQDKSYDVSANPSTDASPSVSDEIGQNSTDSTERSSEVIEKVKYPLVGKRVKVHTDRTSLKRFDGQEGVVKIHIKKSGCIVILGESAPFPFFFEPELEVLE